jgi:hypothetical protein
MDDRSLVVFVLGSLMVAEERIRTKFSGLVGADGSEEKTSYAKRSPRPQRWAMLSVRPARTTASGRGGLTPPEGADASVLARPPTSYARLRFLYVLHSHPTQPSAITNWARACAAAAWLCNSLTLRLTRWRVDHQRTR